MLLAMIGAAVGFAVGISCCHYKSCNNNFESTVEQHLKNLFIEQNVVEASNALKQIGSKAGPYLLMLSKTEVNRPIYKRLPLTKNIFYEQPEKYQLAVEGYVILGPELKDTVPELYRMMLHADKNSRPYFFIKSCYYYVGKDATRHLVNVILEGERSEREFAWKMLESMDQAYEEDLDRLICKFPEYNIIQKMRLLNFMAFVKGLSIKHRQFIESIAVRKNEDDDISSHAQLILEIIRLLEKENQSNCGTPGTKE